MAVVYPVDRDGLLGAIDAAEAGLISQSWSGRRLASGLRPKRQPWTLALRRLGRPR